MAKFRGLCEKGGQGCQVLNLGAGFDTTYWQLKDQVCGHRHTLITVHALTESGSSNSRTLGRALEA